MNLTKKGHRKRCPFGLFPCLNFAAKAFHAGVHIDDIGRGEHQTAQQILFQRLGIAKLL